MILFKDREEAGRLLAKEILKKYNGSLKNPVVFAIPRGGVVVAKPIAEMLKAPIDVILVKKIGAPFNEEIAIATVTEDGKLFINPDITEEVSKKLGITPEYLYVKSKEALQILNRRKKLYGKTITENSLKDRDVILVDDGIATGLTTKSAIEYIKKMSPNKLILAVPVMPYEKYDEFKDLVDDIIVLDKPVNFIAVGQFYEDFSQTTDEEVIDILNRFRE